MGREELPPGRADSGKEVGSPGEEANQQSADSRKPVSIPARGKSSDLVKRRIFLGEDPPKAWEQRDGAERKDGTGPDHLPAGQEVAGKVPPSRPIEPGEQAAPGGGERPRPEPHQRGSRRRKKGGLEGEEAWAGGQRSSLWFVLAGGACLLVVGYFFLAAFRGGDPAPKIAPPVRTAPDQDMTEIPIAEFLQETAELLPALADLLAKVETSRGADLAEVVRGGADSLGPMEKWRALYPASKRHNPTLDRQLHASTTGNIGFLTLTGYNRDFLPSVAYFVKEGGEIKYDWQASEGYGEVIPSKVEQLTDREPKLMRAVATASNYYTELFREEDYRSYSLHHQDPGEFVWAYAERDSLVDARLVGLIRSPALWGTAGRVTLRVRKGPEGSRPNQLEIVEFVHHDWIAPEEEGGAPGLKGGTR